MSAKGSPGPVPQRDCFLAAEAQTVGLLFEGLNIRRDLRVGAWNVMAMSSEGLTSLLTRELRRLRGAMAGLSETHLPRNDLTSDQGYSFCWSGRSDGWLSEKFALTLNEECVRSLVTWSSVIERLLTACPMHVQR